MYMIFKELAYSDNRPGFPDNLKIPYFIYKTQKNREVFTLPGFEILENSLLLIRIYFTKIIFITLLKPFPSSL